jgi:hypothetical protein
MTLPCRGNYVIALLVETMAEEFPGETYDCDVAIRAASLIVVDLHETLM